ncbi:MAG TPA: hypothetical protein VEU31_08500 [Candidatus Acidoferrales bacterium]|nr:hypothetical protein [Candidatus Acidoferrales bacterium]
MRLAAKALLSSLLLLALIWEAQATLSRPEESGSAMTIFDSDPKHIWNRLYDAIFIRKDATGATHGAEELDPLFWSETHHLLTGPSHQHALDVLDEFLRSHAENQIRDPMKRAWLQHNLWAVFDWSARRWDNHKAERRELQIRLAEVLRRLALKPEEIKTLPGNYAQAVASGAFAKDYDPADPDRTFLPPDLFQPTGPWVCVRGDQRPVAEQHVGEFSGRSRFLVFVRLPEGRKATLDYFQELWNAPEPWGAGQRDHENGMLNPTNLPQFPVGTQVALVRQMQLFDANGTLVATPITESVQIRVYRAIPPRIDRNNIRTDWEAARTEQSFHEARLNPLLLFTGKQGGLRAVGRDEREFPVFMTQGEDVFEFRASRRIHLGIIQRQILHACAGCHSAPGINSLQSRRKLLKPNRPQLAPELGINPDDPAYGPLWWEGENALLWKQNRYDWGLLSGYWKASKGLR